MKRLGQIKNRPGLLRDAENILRGQCSEDSGARYVVIHGQRMGICLMLIWLYLARYDSQAGCQAVGPRCLPNTLHACPGADRQLWLKGTYADIRRMSQQEMPQQVMAVYEIPQHAEFKYSGAMVLALDNIQNPGNLGTIIRLAELRDSEVARPGGNEGMRRRSETVCSTASEIPAPSLPITITGEYRHQALRRHKESAKSPQSRKHASNCRAENSTSRCKLFFSHIYVCLIH